MRKLSPEQIQHNTKQWEDVWKIHLFKELQKTNPRIYKVITAPNFKGTKYNTIPTSAYLFGGVGTGKTVEAIWMLIEWTRMRIMNSQPIKGLGLFVTCEELFQSIRNTYNKKSDVTEQTLLDLYQEAEMLVIDDLGVMNTSDWTYKILYQIVDYRYSNFLPTIYTSNMSLADLAKVLGDDRIPDRIQHDCKDNIYNYKRKSRRM